METRVDIRDNASGADLVLVVIGEDSWGGYESVLGRGHEVDDEILLSRGDVESIVAACWYQVVGGYSLDEAWWGHG